MAPNSIPINRAPVLTLWAAVVAQRLGHPGATALTLGRAVAGLNAQSKGQRLGIFQSAAKKAERGTESKVPLPRSVSLLGRSVPVVSTPDGTRAVSKGEPIDPASVERYLEQKFGDALVPAREAMRALAKAHAPNELERIAFELYEEFRPEVPEGTRGWGAKGRLHLDRIRTLARRTGR